MDALGLFLLRYDAIHGKFVDELFTGLTDAQVRERPHGLNSVAWLVWHATRVEDATASRFVADRPQVLEEGDLRRRLAVERGDVGSGMTGDEVEALSARIDVFALRGYAHAVAERTRSVAGSLAPAAWEEIVSPERVHRVVADEGLLVDAGRWVEEFWARGHSRGWYLLQTALLHPYGHWFDAMATRGRLGAPGR
jgi:DinB superfamily